MRVPKNIKTRLVSLAASLGLLGKRLVGARQGGVAMITALAMPPILMVGLGAIQLQAVVTDRQATQDVADAAALWGAQQLTITPTGVEQRTIGFANAQLEGVRANATVTVTATVIGEAAIKVAIATNRPSFFMNLMPAGGFNTHVESVAEGVSQSPLCVLVIGSNAGDDLHMKETSKLQAPNCLVHGNKSVVADGAALIQAQTVEASAAASGPISPSASVGAPPIDDPFAGLDLNFPGLCLLSILDLPVNGALTVQKTTGLLTIHQTNYRSATGRR